jgi:hypothetical protein
MAEETLSYMRRDVHDAVMSLESSSTEAFRNVVAKFTNFAPDRGTLGNLSRCSAR